jgi:hypothetical protein
VRVGRLWYWLRVFSHGGFGVRGCEPLGSPNREICKGSVTLVPQFAAKLSIRYSGEVFTCVPSAVARQVLAHRCEARDHCVLSNLFAATSCNSRAKIFFRSKYFAFIHIYLIFVLYFLLG